MITAMKLQQRDFAISLTTKKIKNYTLVEEDTSYWCAKQQQNKLGKRLVLIYEEQLENDK